MSFPLCLAGQSQPVTEPCCSLRNGFGTRPMASICQTGSRPRNQCPCPPLSGLDSLQSTLCACHAGSSLLTCTAQDEARPGQLFPSPTSELPGYVPSPCAPMLLPSSPPFPHSSGPGSNAHSSGALLHSLVCFPSPHASRRYIDVFHV